MLTLEKKGIVDVAAFDFISGINLILILLGVDNTCFLPLATDSFPFFIDS